MRNKFDEQLKRLHVELIQMGAACEDAISAAAEALLKGDVSLASAAVESERELDRRERDVENLCLKLLLQQQPVARDLRQISAALKMITDMERIGDQAEDIAEIVCTVPRHGPETMDIVRKMATSAIQMVTESIEAFVKSDIMLARKVVSDDDIVDGCFDQVKEALIARIAADPGDGEYAVDLLMIAKYFERIGDHATNIAEWVIFSVTGAHGEGQL